MKVGLILVDIGNKRYGDSYSNVLGPRAILDSKTCDECFTNNILGGSDMLKDRFLEVIYYMLVIGEEHG